MQAFGQHCTQRVLPFGRGLDVLPKLRRVGAFGMRPEIGGFLLSQKLRDGLLLRLQGNGLLLQGLETG